MQMQSIYTNPEQALRLKAAGLPAESADCMLSRMDADYGINDLVTLISEKGEAGENWDYFMDEDAFPCWSLGRLIEMATCLSAIFALNNNLTKFGITITYDTDIVEDFVKWFERFAKMHDNAFKSILPDPKPKPKPEQKSDENCAIRYFHSRCPLNPDAEVDIYTCAECEYYFHTASKSIICKKV